MISCKTPPFFPITTPGFFASMITSPRLGSKFILVISASSETIFFIIRSVSRSLALTDGSERITILFRISFTISDMIKLLSTKTSGFLVYTAKAGPSYSIRVTSASGGIFFSIC